VRLKVSQALGGGVGKRYRGIPECWL